jgi:hypothetical protein
MSAALRNIGLGPNGHIALKAYLDFCNYAVPGLMDESAISERIMRQMRGYGLQEVVVREAISRGFDAAKGKQE